MERASHHEEGRRPGPLDMDSAEWPEWDVWDPSFFHRWEGPLAVFCGIRRVYEVLGLTA